MVDKASLVARWQALSADMDARGVRLLAVSKYAPEDSIACLAAAGQKDFAESRPQQLRDRAQRWPELTWHFIGPLQHNKAKYIGRHADVWHSLCDIEMAHEVARYVEGRRLPVLLQVNISGEAQKQGVTADGLPDLYRAVRKLEAFEIIGLMGMAAEGGDARLSFRQLKALQQKLLQEGVADASLRELCMGMSGDYPVAIEEGATMVRLGTVLFGES